MLGFKQVHFQAHFFIAEQAAKVFTTQYFLLSFLVFGWFCCLSLCFWFGLGFLLLINKANPVLLVYPQGILLFRLFS